MWVQTKQPEAHRESGHRARCGAFTTSASRWTKLLPTCQRLNTVPTCALTWYFVVLDIGELYSSLCLELWRKVSSGIGPSVSHSFGPSPIWYFARIHRTGDSRFQRHKTTESVLPGSCLGRSSHRERSGAFTTSASQWTKLLPTCQRLNAVLTCALTWYFAVLDIGEVYSSLCLELWRKVSSGTGPCVSNLLVLHFARIHRTGDSRFQSHKTTDFLLPGSCLGRCSHGGQYDTGSHHGLVRKPGPLKLAHSAPLINARQGVVGAETMQLRFHYPNNVLENGTGLVGGLGFDADQRNLALSRD